MNTAVERGLAPTRAVLDNGAVVIAKQSPTTPAVTISAAFRAGSICDPPDAPGVAHFLSRVLDRGTERRTAGEIAEALDSRGVSLNVGVSRHLTTIWCTSLVEDFDAMLDLVADIARRPVFPEQEIAIRRGEVTTLIRQDEDNPAVMAVEALMALLYPDGHPYGCRLKGSIDTLTRLDRAALAAFHRARFSPSSLSLVIVGDVEAARAIEGAARAFGDWRAPVSVVPLVPPVVRTSARRRLVMPMMNKVQVDIAYGFVTMARTDPAYHAFSVMNNVLGQYALGGRLGDSIRERQGMAYYIFSALEANVAPGPLVVRAGVAPQNVDRALESIDEEIGRMADLGVTARELADSQQYLVGSLPRMLETNAGIANFLQTAEQFGLGLDYDLRVPGLIRAITLDEANDAARRFLAPDRAAVVVAGPYGETQPHDSQVPGRAASE
jgi:zinc protease